MWILATVRSDHDLHLNMISAELCDLFVPVITAGDKRRGLTALSEHYGSPPPPTPQHLSAGSVNP